MNHFQSIKSICLLLTGVLVGGILLPGSHVHAQCVNRQSLSGPMWEIYGMNPYRPRVKSSVSFTPLQRTINLSPQLALPNCNTPSPATGEIYLGEILAADAPVGAIIESEPSSVNVNSAPPDPKAKAENTGVPNLVPEANPTEETEVGSIPSPSDIVITPRKPKEPTPADESTRVSSTELRDAQAESERLKVELEAAKDKARTAIDRAYAAEKAAAAATQANLERAESQKSGNAKRSGGAWKLVEQLESDAKAQQPEPEKREPKSKPD